MIYVYFSKKWNPSEVEHLRKGDFFKKREDSEIYYIAACDAYQKPDGKWSVGLEVLK